jgi:hypothetical protein
MVWALKPPADDFSGLSIKTQLLVGVDLEAACGVIAKLPSRQNKVVKSSWLLDTPIKSSWF